MKLNTTQYKIIGESKKIYLDLPTVKIREKLNIAFKTPVADSDTTGIYGKYLKKEDLYRVKYIHSRNRQLQPQTYDRYFYLLEVGEDEKGSFVEYVVVYDKLYDPLIRAVYILVSMGAWRYLYYLYTKTVLSSASAIILGVIILATVLITFKKPNESAEKTESAEKIIKNLFDDFC